MTDFLLHLIEGASAGLWKFIHDTWHNSPTFFPGLFGAIFAWFSIRNQKQNSREKNSLDFEAAYKRNDKVVEAWDTVRKIYSERNVHQLSHWGTKDTEQTPEAKALATIFNEWERCANAVNNGLYDDHYLYRVYGSTLIFLDVHFSPYIEERRKINPRFYRNMKILALTWRIRRAYEDSDGEAKEYIEQLKEAEKCVEKLKITY